MIKNMIMEADISDEDKEIALYGMERLAMLTASIGVSILIGIATGELKGVILFLVMFVPLRVFAGGLHMPKLWICGIASSMLITAVALLVKNIEPEKLITPGLFLLCLISTIIIIVLAPVDTENKRLFSHERRRFKIISAVLASAELAVIFFQGVMPRVKMIAEISLMTESIYLIIQELINVDKGIHKTNGQRAK